MRIEDGLPDNPLDEPAEVRVARGARLLDEHRPGWRGMINPATLDMNDGANCVAGQLYGSYGQALYELGISTGVQASRYGFHAMAPVAHRDDLAVILANLDALRPLWLAEIERVPSRA